VSEGYGAAMISALKKLARENFARLAPSKINVVLEYSHPPLGERIAAVEKELKK
jgi:STE24 endopeptidase